MASLELDPASGRYRVRFRYAGQSYWSAPIFSTRGYESMVWVRDSAVCCWSEGVARTEAAHCDANSDGVW